jgi:hypothetical protein
VRKRIQIGLCSLLLLSTFLVPDQARAALMTELTTATVQTGVWGTSSPGYVGPANKIYAPYGVTLTSATIPFCGANNRFDLAITIYRDSAGSPGTALSGQFTYSTISNSLATLTGSITIPSAGYYWVQVNSPYGGDYNCYTNAINYSGSASGWVVYSGLIYGTSGSGNVATAWASFGGQYGYQMDFTLYSNGPGTVSLTAPSQVATARSVLTLTATTSGAGSVTFLANSKKIPSCIKVTVTGTTATCSWKPASLGSTQLIAVFTPTGAATVTSQPISVFAIRRTTPR